MSENLKRLEVAAELRVKRLAEEFSQKINALKDQIATLEQKKLGIIKGRISRAEAIEKMKQDLMEGEKNFVLERFVRPNLASYQMGYRTLSSLDHLKVHQLANAEWIGFIYHWITPEMIDSVGKDLPDGPNEKERNEKIKQLDREIQQVERQMEEVLK